MTDDSTARGQVSFTAMVRSDGSILDDIARHLDGKAWDSDTTAHIAELVRLTGRRVRDVDDPVYRTLFAYNGEFMITLEQTDEDKPTFRVTYGAQEDTTMSYAQAALLLGGAIMHSLACAGELHADENDNDPTTFKNPGA